MQLLLYPRSRLRWQSRASWPTEPSRPSLRPRRPGRSGMVKYLSSTSKTLCAFARARPTSRRFDNANLSLRCAVLVASASDGSCRSAVSSWLKYPATLSSILGVGCVIEPRNNKLRTHVSLGKDAPCTRPIERFGDIVAHPILGGLHHRYGRI